MPDGSINADCFLWGVLVTLLVGCAGAAPSREPPAPTEPPSLESWQSAFVSCVSPFGVRGGFPILSEGAARQFTGKSAVLSEPGIVSDGYSHSLRLNQAGTEAIIVQTGGFGHLTTRYGPVKLSAGCVAPRASVAAGHP